jgi:hypothetical protein
MVIRTDRGAGTAFCEDGDVDRDYELMVYTYRSDLIIIPEEPHKWIRLPGNWEAI